MSKIDELLEALCPDGVEYKKLKEVCRFQNGFSFKSAKFTNEGKPILRITNIQDNSIGGEFVCFSKDDYKENLESYLVSPGDTVVAMSGATTGKIGYNYSDKYYYLNQRVGLFVPNESRLMKRYLFHWLSTQTQNIYNVSSGSGAQPNLSSVKMMEFVIPIPPLEVQREIVRILDSFTLLTAELTAELTARKKQYEYYRDELLGRKTVETKEVFLEDIATYSKERIPANEVDEYSYVGVDNLLQEKRGKTISSHVPTDGNLTKYYPGDILIGNIRPYLRKIWFADNIGGTNGDVLVINVTSDKVLPQYLYYNLSSERFFEYDIAKSKGAKMPRGDKDAVMKYNLLLPPIATQKRIVDVLNNFEKICNDISEGLPAEIEARQKQYEFYRDKLLSFEQL